MRSPARRGLAIVGAAAAVAAGGAAGWALTRAPAPDVEGEIEGREISVSSPLPARVRQVFVREGDTVRAGQLLAVLRATAITAVTQQTQALAEATRATSEAAEQFRPEQVASARALYGGARTAAANASDTYRRVRILYDSGVASREELKLAQTAASATRSQEEVARQSYELLRRGPRPETRAALAALQREAAAAQRAGAAIREDTLVTAPVPGVVQEVLLNAGESALPGTPVVTLMDPRHVWVTLELPETQVAQIAVGTRITGRVPALADRRVTFRVVYVAPLAAFATERPTSASGGFDVRQFEVRAEPERPVPGLRPGMTAIFPWPRAG